MIEPKLTDEQVLDKAIGQAIAGGWSAELLGGAEEWRSELSELERQHVLKLLFTEGEGNGYILLIFDHGFAKALWGESWANFTEGQSGDSFSMQAQNWKGHLMNMVLAVKPINYLRKNI